MGRVPGRDPEPPPARPPPSPQSRHEDPLPALVLEAFGSGRAAILRLLAEGPHRYTGVAQHLAASESEVSRNLNRLLEAGLVAKAPNGAFGITPLGSALAAFLPTLSVLAAHADDFRTHAVHALPRPFLHRLDALATAEVLRDPFRIFAGIETVFAGVETFFYGQWVLGKPAMGEEELAMQRMLRERIVARKADARGLMLPEEAAIVRRALPAVDSYFAMRVIPAAPVSFAVSDRAALLQFQEGSGPIDFNFAFFGTSPEFCGWCRDLFLHEWAEAGRAP